MKKLLLILSIATLAIFAVGCTAEESVEGDSQDVVQNVEQDGAADGAQDETEDEAASSGIIYTNMANGPSISELEELFKEFGVEQSSIEKYFDLLNDFNSRVLDYESIAGDYIPLDGQVDYSNVQIDPINMYETNCRLATYALTKNYITTVGVRDFNDTFLMFDVEMMRTEPLHITTEEDINNFSNFFGSVSVEGLVDLEAHIEAIKNLQKEMGAELTLPEGMNIINIYLHSTYDDLRFIGHSGVLFEGGDGLVFVEKYGPYAPFQMTKFQTRQELADYILTRGDIYAEHDELDPIIFENLELMEY